MTTYSNFKDIRNTLQNAKLFDRIVSVEATYNYRDIKIAKIMSLYTQPALLPPPPPPHTHTELNDILTEAVTNLNANFNV